jgi:hypothetical protein
MKKTRIKESLFLAGIVLSISSLNGQTQIEDSNPDFFYSQTSYCVSELNPLPTINGDQGGIFSSSNGIILNLSVEEPAGIYIVSIQSGDKRAVFRLTKE